MGSEELVQTIRRLAGRDSRRDAGLGVNTSPGCAFGAVVEQRLLNLERSLSEIKARLNGLIFVVVGAVVVEMVMRFIR